MYLIWKIFTKSNFWYAKLLCWNNEEPYQTNTIENLRNYRVIYKIKRFAMRMKKINIDIFYHDRHNTKFNIVWHHEMSLDNLDIFVTCNMMLKTCPLSSIDEFWCSCLRVTLKKTQCMAGHLAGVTEVTAIFNPVKQIIDVFRFSLLLP